MFSYSHVRIVGFEISSHWVDQAPEPKKRRPAARKVPGCTKATRAQSRLNFRAFLASKSLAANSAVASSAPASSAVALNITEVAAANEPGIGFEIRVGPLAHSSTSFSLLLFRSFYLSLLTLIKIFFGGACSSSGIPNGWRGFMSLAVGLLWRKVRVYFF